MSPSVGTEQAISTPSTIATITFSKEDKSFTVASGANFRQKAVENQIDLYTLKGKITNCGGIGQCATCMVEIEAGMENLSPKSEFEERKLKRKPENYRLACQTMVHGPVTVKTKPPKK